MKLVVATGNAGKLRELNRILAGQGIELLSLADFPELDPVEEDGETFAENAEKKAVSVARRTGLPTLADDSGLEVEALQMAPGVYSARYAGESASDADNNRKLLVALQGVVTGNRQARFVCVLALAFPGGDCRLYRGELPGEILDVGRGSDGFGYDPLFYLPSEQCAMAELPVDQKNRISHRAQALRQLLPELPQLLVDFYDKLGKS